MKSTNTPPRKTQHPLGEEYTSCFLSLIPRPSTAEVDLNQFTRQLLPFFKTNRAKVSESLENVKGKQNKEITKIVNECAEKGQIDCEKPPKALYTILYLLPYEIIINISQKIFDNLMLREKIKKITKNSSSNSRIIYVLKK